MTFNVSEQVIQATTRCPCHFSCLSFEKKQCEVISIIQKNELLLKSKEKIDCPYQVSFEDGFVCKCPTHFSIYTNRKKN